MNTQQPIQPIQPAKSSTLPWIVAIGAITFTLGVSGALLLTQSRQNTQNDAFAAMLLQMQQQQNQVDVSRAATPDLLAVTQPTAAPIQDITPEIEDAAADFLEIVPPTPLAEFKPIDLSESARERAMAAVADPDFDPNNTTREETISVAIAGVSEIALDVIDGKFDVVSDAETGQLRLNVPSSQDTAATLEVLLARASANGDIALHESVAGSNGIVDPQTLLFDLVQRSLENGSAVEVEAGRELRRRAFAAASAETTTIEGERFYTVESGDSLAFIALQFYGSTSAYGRIFEANRDKLNTPDNIQIGQSLRIPSV